MAATGLGPRSEDPSASRERTRCSARLGGCCPLVATVSQAASWAWPHVPQTVLAQWVRPPDTALGIASPPPTPAHTLNDLVPAPQWTCPHCC